MKLSGIQYYLLIFVGLILGLVLSIPETIEEFEEKIISNLALLIPLIIVSLYCTVCFFVAVFEMWGKYNYKLLIVIVLIYVAGEYLHSSLFLLYEITPTAYWLWRIKGIKN